LKGFVYDISTWRTNPLFCIGAVWFWSVLDVFPILS
jgi:hypothetical protein